VEGDEKSEGRLDVKIIDVSSASETDDNDDDPDYDPIRDH